jgi:hypothetical protein
MKLSCLNTVKRRNPSIAIVQSTRDRSGSMGSYKNIAGKSLYQSIIDHQSTDVLTFYSLTTFDHEVERPYVNVDVNTIKLSEQEAIDLVRPRGMTRLFTTAIEDLARLRKSVKKKKKENPRAEVVGVFELHTDGHDNKSRFTAEDLNAAVTSAREEGITCIFAGANQDAVSTGCKYGFDKRCSLTTDSTPDRAHEGLRVCSQAVMRACSGSSAQFTQNERQISAPVPLTTQEPAPASAPASAPATMPYGIPPQFRQLFLDSNCHSVAYHSPPPLVRQTNFR